MSYKKFSFSFDLVKTRLDAFSRSKDFAFGLGLVVGTIFGIVASNALLVLILLTGGRW